VIGDYVSVGRIRLPVRLINTSGMGGVRTRGSGVATELSTELSAFLQINQRFYRTISVLVQYSEGRAGIQYQLYSIELWTVEGQDVNGSLEKTVYRVGVVGDSGGMDYGTYHFQSLYHEYHSYDIFVMILGVVYEANNSQGSYWYEHMASVGYCQVY